MKDDLTGIAKYLMKDLLGLDDDEVAKYKQRRYKRIDKRADRYADIHDLNRKTSKYEPKSKVDKWAEDNLPSIGKGGGMNPSDQHRRMKPTWTPDKDSSIWGKDGPPWKKKR